MNKIEEFDYINNLFILYGTLLTDKQSRVIESYYKFNLSLSEISEELSISRSAVLDMLEHAKKKLYDYEDKLNILKKNNMIKKIVCESKLSDKDKEKILEII